MPEITVLNNDDVRQLPYGRYRVIRGNAEVRVIANTRARGTHGHKTRELLVVLRYPCTLESIDEDDEDDS